MDPPSTAFEPGAVGSRDEATPLSRAFGAAVRRVREARGLSQEELAFRANLDRTYISGIERGRRNPTLMSMATLARALRTKPSRLLASAERALEAAR